MPNLEEITELFVQIRRAEWAGDLETCLELIDKFKRLENEYETDTKNIYEEQVRIFAEDFSPLEELSEIVEIIDGHINQSEKSHSILIQTNNLRAVICRVDEYVFKLRGYLFDLELEDKFDEKIKTILKEYHKSFNSEIVHIESIPSQWTNVIGDMRIKTSIGEFGLFEMTGTWLGCTNQISQEEIKNSFEKNLTQIEVY